MDCFSEKRNYDHYLKGTTPTKINKTPSTHTVTSELYIQLKILFTDKRLCYGNHLRPVISNTLCQNSKKNVSTL